MTLRIFAPVVITPDSRCLSSCATRHTASPIAIARSSNHDVSYNVPVASVVQRIGLQSSELLMGVRFPPDALYTSHLHFPVLYTKLQCNISWRDSSTELFRILNHSAFPNSKLNHGPPILPLPVILDQGDKSSHKRFPKNSVGNSL